jgi:hypothetical protein
MLKLLLLGLVIYGVYKYFAIANRLQAGIRKRMKENGGINIEINIDRKPEKVQEKKDDYTDYEEMK